MKKPAKVIMKILSVQGNCETKHHPGQEFDLSGDITLSTAGNPGTVCPALYYAIYPNLRLLRFGGSLPWEKDPNVAQRRLPGSGQSGGGSASANFRVNKAILIPDRSPGAPRRPNLYLSGENITKG